MSTPSTPSINHLVLNVRDIDRSHRFYTEVLGFEQCGDLTHTMTMRFYRGDPSHHHDLALAQIENPDRVPPPEPWAMAPTACRGQPHRHRLPRSGVVAQPAAAHEGPRRRGHRPRQPRDDAFGVHRRSRRVRTGGALQRPGRRLGGRRRCGAELLRVPGPRRPGRPRRLPTLRARRDGARRRCPSGSSPGRPPPVDRVAGGAAGGRGRRGPRRWGRPRRRARQTCPRRPQERADVHRHGHRPRGTVGDRPGHHRASSAPRDPR